LDDRRHSWIDPKDLLGGYERHPFTVELKELFGESLIGEIEQMIGNDVTLRSRGLIDPAVPIPPSRAPGELLRDLPGTRAPGAPTAPAVQPPVAPGVPAVRPPARVPTAPTAPGGPAPPAAPAPPATTTPPPAVGPTPGTAPAPPAIDPRRLQQPVTPGGPTPQPRPPLQ
jgi:hypothetical protein